MLLETAVVFENGLFNRRSHALGKSQDRRCHDLNSHVAEPNFKSEALWLTERVAVL
jgi:hypothetical protein